MLLDKSVSVLTGAIVSNRSTLDKKRGRRASTCMPHYQLGVIRAEVRLERNEALARRVVLITVGAIIPLPTMDKAGEVLCGL